MKENDNCGVAGTRQTLSSKLAFKDAARMSLSTAIFCHTALLTISSIYHLELCFRHELKRQAEDLDLVV